MGFNVYKKKTVNINLAEGQDASPQSANDKKKSGSFNSQFSRNNKPNQVQSVKSGPIKKAGGKEDLQDFQEALLKKWA